MVADNDTKNIIKDHQEFIVAEYNYIAQSAFQANEDRARVSEFFLISFGTFLAALFSSQIFNDPDTANFVFSIIFSVVAFLGALTILELTRLRLAWLESALAMNKMKDFLINNAPELKECFSWRTHTIPAAFKIKSVGFLKALQVSALSGVALGASTTFISFYRGCADVAWNRSLIIAGITTFIYMVGIYFMPLFFAKSARDLRLLKKEKKEAQANNDDQ